MMNKLKDILLAEDREELLQLRKSLDDPILLSEKVTPIIQEQLAFFKKNFPVEFRIAVEEVIDRKLENSREELLEVIYPALGQMVKKYIQHQFQLLKDNIEEQIRAVFQRGIIGRLRYAIFGIKPKEMSELILSGLDSSAIEEIFVIEHFSGILLGSASKQDTIDLDMIAGMLTAIKSFVEDAFKRGNEQLEIVQYETFSLIVENFHTYYIVAALSGSISSKERAALSDELIRFAKEELRMNLKKQDGSSHYEIKQKIERRFFHPQKTTLADKSKNNNLHD